MAIVAPTITASDVHEYREQMTRVEPFAKRVHIDLMDGIFAPTKSPELEQVWWPHGIMADIHLMFQKPMDSLPQLIKMKPHMVIIHFESDVHHMHFAAELHKHDIKSGLAILHDTQVKNAEQIIHSFDQVLVFSGHLGYHGGQADLTLLDKVKQIRNLHSDTEIAWDGGISDQNAEQLVLAGVEVLNTGSFIQNARDPAGAYATITSVISDK